MLTDLMEKRGRLVAQAREALEEINKNTDEARAAELDRRHDEIMAEYDANEKRIAKEERTAAAERALEEAGDHRRPRGADGQQRGLDDPQPMDYRTAFHAYLRAQGNVGAMNLQERTALERGYSDLSAEERAQTTSNAAGGYSIPEQMMERVVVALAAWGPMYEGGPVEYLPTEGGNTMPFPYVDDTASTAGAHTEGATLTDDGGKDITFAPKQLDAYAFDTEWLRVSRELATDSFIAMEMFVGSRLGERLARIANAQLTTGTGSSAPNGIVTASTLGKTAASATAVTLDEIIDLEHSVDPAYRNGPSVGYMFHDTTLQAIRKLKDGEGNYLWQMGDVKAGVPSTLNGRPYWINQDMPPIATGNKSMLFGKFDEYIVRKVGDILIGAIQDKDFWPGFGMAGYIRFDGELGDGRAVKHLIQA